MKRQENLITRKDLEAKELAHCHPVLCRNCEHYGYCDNIFVPDWYDEYLAQLSEMTDHEYYLAVYAPIPDHPSTEFCADFNEEFPFY